MQVACFWHFWPFLPVLLKIANLRGPLWTQIRVNSIQPKYWYALLYKCFQVSGNIFWYLGYPQSRFFRKRQFILLRNIRTGMVWVKRCLNLWNCLYFMLVFYLKWFGPEKTSNEAGNYFLPPLYLPAAESANCRQFLQDMHGKSSAGLLRVVLTP